MQFNVCVYSGGTFAYPSSSSFSFSCLVVRQSVSQLAHRNIHLLVMLLCPGTTSLTGVSRRVSVYQSCLLVEPARQAGSIAQADTVIATATRTRSPALFRLAECNLAKLTCTVSLTGSFGVRSLCSFIHQRHWQHWQLSGVHTWPDEIE